MHNVNLVEQVIIKEDFVNNNNYEIKTTAAKQSDEEAICIHLSTVTSNDDVNVDVSCTYHTYVIKPHIYDVHESFKMTHKNANDPDILQEIVTLMVNSVLNSLQKGIKLKHISFTDLFDVYYAMVVAAISVNG